MAIDAYHLSILLGALVFSFLLVSWSKVSFFVKIPWAYFLLYSVLNLFLYPISGVPVSTESAVLTLASAKYLVPLLFLPMIFQKYDGKWFRPIIGLIILADAIYLIRNPSSRTMFAGNTQDAIVFALTIILINKDFWLGYVSAGILLFAILQIKGATSFAILGAYAALTLITNRNPLGFVAIFFIGLVLLVWPEIMNGERLEFWTPYMNYWLEKESFLFGLGPGSFEWLNVLDENLKDQFGRMWLHGDWIQILWEMGFVGLVMALSVYSYTLFRLFKRKDWQAFNFMACLAIGMMFYSPIQFAQVQVLVGLVMRRALEEGA